MEGESRDRHLAKAERWFAEKGVEWQALVMTQLGSRAQAVASLAGFVPPFLLGGATIAALGKLDSATQSSMQVALLIGSCALIGVITTFVFAAKVIYPGGQFGFPTPEKLVESLFDKIDAERPEAAVDRTVAALLKECREKNTAPVAKMQKSLRLSIWALVCSIVLSIAFVVCIATILTRTT